MRSAGRDARATLRDGRPSDLRNGLEIAKPQNAFLTEREKSALKTKFPETLDPGCLCNGVKAPDHEQKLHLDGIEKPGIQKTLDCHGDLGNLRCRA